MIGGEPFPLPGGHEHDYATAVTRWLPSRSPFTSSWADGYRCACGARSWLRDPAANLAAGLRAIRERYGSMAPAWDTYKSEGGYMAEEKTQLEALREDIAHAVKAFEGARDALAEGSAVAAGLAMARGLVILKHEPEARERVRALVSDTADHGILRGARFDVAQVEEAARRFATDETLKAAREAALGSVWDLPADGGERRRWKVDSVVDDETSSLVAADGQQPLFRTIKVVELVALRDAAAAAVQDAQADQDDHDRSPLAKRQVWFIDGALREIVRLAQLGDLRVWTADEPLDEEPRFPLTLLPYRVEELRERGEFVSPFGLKAARPIWERRRRARAKVALGETYLRCVGCTRAFPAANMPVDELCSNCGAGLEEVVEVDGQEHTVASLGKPAATAGDGQLLFVVTDGPPAEGGSAGTRESLIRRMRLLSKDIDMFSLSDLRVAARMLGEGAEELERVGGQFVELEDQHGAGVGEGAARWESYPEHVQGHASGLWRLGPFLPVGGLLPLRQRVRELERDLGRVIAERDELRGKAAAAGTAAVERYQELVQVRSALRRLRQANVNSAILYAATNNPLGWPKLSEAWGELARLADEPQGTAAEASVTLDTIEALRESVEIGKAMHEETRVALRAAEARVAELEGEAGRLRDVQSGLTEGLEELLMRVSGGPLRHMPSESYTPQIGKGLVDRLWALLKTRAHQSAAVGDYWLLGERAWEVTGWDPPETGEEVGSRLVHLSVLSGMGAPAPVVRHIRFPVGRLLDEGELLRRGLWVASLGGEIAEEDRCETCEGWGRGLWSPKGTGGPWMAGRPQVFVGVGRLDAAEREHAVPCPACTGSGLKLDNDEHESEPDTEPEPTEDAEMAGVGGEASRPRATSAGLPGLKPLPRAPTLADCQDAVAEWLRAAVAHCEALGRVVGVAYISELLEAFEAANPGARS